MPTDAMNSPRQILVASGFASPADRFAVLDVMRGIAALSVMYFHLTFAGPLFPAHRGDLAWVRESGAYGWLGVEVFFVISGFVLPYAMWRGGYRLVDFWRFASKRLKRLEPPYLFAIMITLALSALTSRQSDSGGASFVFDAKQLLLHVGYLIPFSDEQWLSPVFWTLAVEFQFYLLIALAFPLLQRLRHVWLAPLLMGAVAWWGTDIFLLPVYLGLFAMGLTVMLWYQSRLSTGTLAVITLLLAVPTTLSLTVAHALVGVVSAALIALGVSRPLRLPALRPLLLLGAMSYSLYLLHIPVGGMVLNLGGQYDALGPRLVFLLLAIVASLVAAAAVWRFVERPSQRWSAATRYRRS